MLEIKNLHVAVEETPILRGIDLTVNAGEVHAIMGPNGGGKSTLAQALAGHEAYEVTEGSATLEGVDLLEMDPDERARAGVFLAFQYPIEIPGVNNTQFLRAALNAHRKARGEDDIEPAAFMKLVHEKLDLLEIDRDMLKRSVNEGFSGGEKKRFEILQMAMLKPEIAVLDETDSGLDIDALKIVADGVNRLRGSELGTLIITHYTRILNYIQPDEVHVMFDGRIVTSGGPELADELEAKGYEDIVAGANA